MQDGWIWADEESLDLPLGFAWDDDDEEGWDDDLDWEGEDDDLDEEWDDGEEEDAEEKWAEWEAGFAEDDEDSLGRKKHGRPEWN
ncbi:MAG: hypothetical protein HKO65_13195 [Gemmatimonadetes bacterium]|nr:hypothetical protein [Gemmatimonadota bacterium]NNM06039.1 hypothetical protein [Gemmatimonadota bacterium]